MTVEIKLKSGFVTDYYFINVWEIQDVHNEILIKFHDHSCRRFNKADIKDIDIKIVIQK